MRCALPRRSSAAPPLEDEDRCCGRARKCARRANSPEKGRSIVEPTAVSPFAAWESFYVIVGSSAAALTGLQFVVITLIADARVRRTQREINVYGTPIGMHFSVVLLVSAILSAPWRMFSDPALWITVIGIAGLSHAVLTRRRSRLVAQQLPDTYKPVLEDKIWYLLMPTL